MMMEQNKRASYFAVVWFLVQVSQFSLTLSDLHGHNLRRNVETNDHQLNRNLWLNSVLSSSKLSRARHVLLERALDLNITATDETVNKTNAEVYEKEKNRKKEKILPQQNNETNRLSAGAIFLRIVLGFFSVLGIVQIFIFFRWLYRTVTKISVLDDIVAPIMKKRPCVHYNQVVEDDKQSGPSYYWWYVLGLLSVILMVGIYFLVTEYRKQNKLAEKFKKIPQEEQPNQTEGGTQTKHATKKRQKKKKQTKRRGRRRRGVKEKATEKSSKKSEGSSSISTATVNAATAEESATKQKTIQEDIINSNIASVSSKSKTTKTNAK